MKAFRLPRLGRRGTDEHDGDARARRTRDTGARARVLTPRSGYDPSALSPLTGPPAAPGASEDAERTR